MQTAQPKVNRTTVNYLVDITIFLAFLVTMNPHATGMSVHEWLGIAFGGAIVTHLLLHWQWIVGITRRFFSQVSNCARLNYLVNLLFFIDMTIIIFTGLMISESALPTLGITLANRFAWRGLHTTAANLALPILGLHVALHWRWIVNTTKSYFRKVQPATPNGAVNRLPKGLVQKGI
jgi:hypothetical protein